MPRHKLSSNRFTKIGGDVAPCPECGKRCTKHSVRYRMIQDINGVWNVEHAYHRCRSCNVYFNNPDCSLHFYGQSNYSRAFVELALNVAIGHTLHETVRRVEAATGVKLRPSTIHDWVKAKGDSHG